MYPDTLPVYSAGAALSSGLPCKIDTSNRGGLSKALGETANPHSTLTKGLMIVQLKVTEEPTVSFTVLPP